jgi:signal transduction histidine kinase
MVDYLWENRQRALAERLLLRVLREQDTAETALEDGARGRFVASVSRDLAESLDEAETRAAVARCALPRGDSWCIVDIIELDGGLRRLAIAHPDPSRQAVAQEFADRWLTTPGIEQLRASDAERRPTPAEVDETGGFGSGRILPVPLAVRGAVLGAITFVTSENEPPFSPDERALASDIAHLCALALDNARLYSEAQLLRKLADVANRAKSTFLSTMSHELMTPLNAIGGYVTLMEMGLRGPVTAEQRGDLARIRQNQAHLLTLISEVLAHAQNEGKPGRLEYRFGEVSVDAMLREVVAMLQAAVDERHITLARAAAPDDAMVWADAVRMRQILLNLVMNAVKYGKQDDGRITLEAAPARETIAIHVTDDGEGIPEEKLEAIFDPFVQLPKGLSDARGGVGLGLAISRDLARAMNGDLTVSSVFGRGSRFTLELPRARRPRT